MKRLSTIIGHPARLLTGLALCATALPGFAEEPTSSREYPPTYTDRVTPWYDPSGWFRKIDNVFTKDDPAAKTEKLPVVTAVPVPGSSLGSPDVLLRPLPGEAVPAWKWYGYGTVTPNQNPLAPTGQYRPVPVDWHAQSGTTPGAIPGGGAPLTVISKPLADLPSPLTATKPDVGSPPLPPKSDIPLIDSGSPSKLTGPDITMPAIGSSKDEELRLPAVVIPPSIMPDVPIAKGEDNVVEPAPARLRIPTPVAEEPPPSTREVPAVGASLRSPLRTTTPETPVIPAPVPTPAPEQPRPPVEQPARPVSRPNGAALPNANTNSPDIPVEAAPDIVIPGSMSHLPQPGYTVRAQQPVTLEESICRAAGDMLRDLRPAGPNAYVVVLKPGNIDAAWQARERLSQLPQLKRLTITFEIAAR